MTNSWDNPYPVIMGTDTSLSPWPTITSSGKELDLREEFRKLLYGAIDEEAKGQIGMLRRMRRDANNNWIMCPCRNAITDEPDKDFVCRYCSGMGKLWDEREIVYYIDSDSMRKYGEVLFYLEYRIWPTDGDYIVPVMRDLEGTPTKPVTREYSIYKIKQAAPFRSDSGRIEYWRCRTDEERNWSVYHGVASRQHSPSS